MIAATVSGGNMRGHAAIGMAMAALLGGCSREATDVNEVDIASAADAARGSVGKYAASPRASPQPRRSRVAPRPTPSPASSATAAAEAPAALVAVLERYYAAIRDGRYADAWHMWDDDGAASGMSERAFADSFARFADYRARVGAPGRVDAGAGQRHVTVPVYVSGRLKDGGRFAMEGPVTLHRVADIDGATAEQRRWRISESGVRARPLDAASPPTRLTAHYRCSDATSFVATFDNVADTATLRFEAGGEATLAGQRPASGIWYRGDGHELRGKGRDATLTRGRAAPVTCVADR